MNMIDLLDQDKVWVDATGATHDLATMDPHHRANLIPFLRRQAERLHIAWLMSLPTSQWDDDNGVLDQLWNEPDDEWLEATPLMRRLVELDQRGPVQRAGTKVRNRLYPLRKMLGVA